VSWLTEEEVARKLRDLTADSTAWLGRPSSGQFSLAGAQAKTALLHENGRWGVPSGAVPTTHILKPAVAGLDDHDLNEHLCLDAARRSGLLAAKTWVATFDDQSAIVVERYDRIGGENGYVRVHQEDMCQALSVAPSRRYQNEGGPSPESIVASMRSAMPMREADEDVWRFIDALALNWIIGGTDAHAKNYSLLLGGAAFRLAPLYDVASTLPYGLHEKQLRLAMKLGGSYDVFIRRNPWPATAALLQVEREELTERVRALAATLPAALVDSASEPAIATLGRDLPSRLCDVVLHRAARCLEVLDD
jgi:serine/threonine-protein kinase HipA